MTNPSLDQEPATSRFLPPPASPKHAYGIAAASRSQEFSGQSTTLIQDRVPRRMRFAHGSTEARVPTPFSRAYLFYFGLNGGFLLPDAAQHGEDTAAQQSAETSQAREELLKRARGAFRGVCALFALRQVLQFDLEFKQAGNLSDPAKQGSVVYRMLARHVAADPHGAAWDTPGYYVLRTAGGNEVVAGVSPLTGFFPAARRPGAIPAAYWYDPVKGWSDPGETGRKDWGGADIKLQANVRRLLLAWVTEVHQRLAVGARPMQASLVKLGLSHRDVAYLITEFAQWRDDLTANIKKSGLPGNAPAACQDAPIPGQPDGAGVPFFTLACTGNVGSDLASLADGTLVVTSDDLTNPLTRLHGPVSGSPDHLQALPKLPLDGKNLGEALGLGERAIPRPYVYLNKCLTPKLLQITTATLNAGLNEEWTALTPASTADPKAGDQAQAADAFLFPVVPETLKYLPLDQLQSAITLAHTPKTEGWSVTLSLGGAQVTQIYGGPDAPEYTLDRSLSAADRFDLRVFPNLRLDEISTEVLPADSPDRVYFARLRLSPEWGTPEVPESYFQAYRGKDLIKSESTDPGSFTDAQGQNSSSGRARFMSFRETPEAFYLKDRGFCLVNLHPHAFGKGEPVATWEIAMDFGTSNTCVAYRNPAVGNPGVLKLPVLTTSLQRRPGYGRIQNSDEGQSAIVDFFLYDPAAKDAPLHSLDFFPSQVATREQSTPVRGQHGALRNGMVVFKNFSQIILENLSVAQLLEEFAGAQPAGAGNGQSPKPRFRIVQNIKWSDDTWMDVFMNSLRRQVVIAAAARNARIRRLIFSHPKSFSSQQVENFDTVVTGTWKSRSGADPTPELISESEGVRSYIARNGHRDAMVFDIGGGTTDVLAFRGEKPFFQMSFKLAAGMVDRYVIASDKLRRQLSAAALEILGESTLLAKLEGLGFHKPADLQEEHLAPSPEMIRAQTVWHGLLSDLDRRDELGMRKFARSLASNVYERAETKDDAKEAIRGFFLSLLVTFGGLAYLGGMMNRAMRAMSARPGGGADNAIELSFIGNGGKYYELLDNRKGGGATFLQEIFIAGDGRDGKEGREQVAVKCVGVFESARSESFGGKQPKAAIALGMLLGAQENAEPPPICNLLGENEFSSGAQMFSNHQRLEEFYREMPLDQGAHIVRGAVSAYGGFLEALETAAPGGLFGDSVAVPGLHDGWVKQWLKPLGDEVTRRTRARLQANARRWQEESRRTRPREIALEPVFVAELASLLEVIRESHLGR